MKFSDPFWFIPGIAACALLVWSFRAFDRRQLAAMATFASGHLLAQLTTSLSARRRLFKRALLLVAVASMFATLARPQWGFRWEEAKRRGVDVLFAVDTSKSMLTQDVKPDRIGRAKLAVTDLVNKLDGDRVGLIAFAGTAYLQAPLTLDYDAFGESLDALDTNTIPRGGTNIASAILEAQKALSLEGNNEKILILMTDGEDLDAEGIAAAGAAAKDGLKIFTVGIGTASGGLIPIPSDNGGNEFVKDATGQVVTSHLDEKTLKQIAQATGGIYEPLGAQGLDTIYEQGIAPLVKHDLASRMQRVYIERYKWPLALALLCLALEMVVGDRKRRIFSRAVRPSEAGVPVRPRRKPALAGTAAATALLLVCGPRLHASTQSAEQAYQHKDYATASKEYDAAAKAHPQQPALFFNTGSAAYKAGDFGKASNSFQTTLHTDDLPLQEKTYYNLGDTQYRLGQQTEKTKPEETIKTWKTAVTSYDSALQLNAKDVDAKFNRDFVQKKLDQLQQKQKQQKQKQNQQQQKQEQNNQQQPQDQKQNGSGNKQQQNQKGTGQKQDQAKDQSGTDNKDQQSHPLNSNGQQPKQGEQAKNQSGSGDKQPGKGNQQKPQPASAGGNQQQPQGQQPQGQQGQGQPQQMAKADQSQPQPVGQPSPNQGQAGQDQSAAAPGEMSKEDAKALLDSLKSGERKMPIAQAPLAPGSPQDDKPLQDW